MGKCIISKQKIITITRFIFFIPFFLTIHLFEMAYSIVSRLDALAIQYESLTKSIQEQQNNLVDCACDLEEINAADEVSLQNLYVDIR
jgi:hypothetical protein